MLINQGRDTTIDPYYFSKSYIGNMSPSDIDEIKAQVAALTNSVNNISTIVDELRQEGAKIQIKTSTDWAEEEDNTSFLGLIYVYQDNQNGKIVQNIKIGDGVTKLGALNFINTGGVTEEEKEYWNNKVSISIDESDETLNFIR